MTSVDADILAKHRKWTSRLYYIAFGTYYALVARIELVAYFFVYLNQVRGAPFAWPRAATFWPGLTATATVVHPVRRRADPERLGAGAAADAQLPAGRHHHAAGDAAPLLDVCHHLHGGHDHHQVPLPGAVALPPPPPPGPICVAALLLTLEWAAPLPLPRRHGQFNWGFNDIDCSENAGYQDDWFVVIGIQDYCGAFFSPNIFSELLILLAAFTQRTVLREFGLWDTVESAGEAAADPAAGGGSGAGAGAAAEPRALEASASDALVVSVGSGAADGVVAIDIASASNDADLDDLDDALAEEEENDGAPKAPKAPLSRTLCGPSPCHAAARPWLTRMGECCLGVAAPAERLKDAVLWPWRASVRFVNAMVDTGTSLGTPWGYEPARRFASHHAVSGSAHTQRSSPMIAGFGAGHDYYLYMFMADLVVFLLTVLFFDDFSGEVDQDLEFVRRLTRWCGLAGARCGTGLTLGTVASACVPPCQTRSSSKTRCRPSSS